MTQPLVTVAPLEPNPDGWRAARPRLGRPQGSCFHQALDRWRTLENARQWRIAVGIVPGNPFSGGRHIHAWLENKAMVISAVMGRLHNRDEFYRMVEVERDSVRLVKPRRIINDAPVTNATVIVLLDAWGRGRWTVDEFGGVVPK